MTSMMGHTGRIRLQPRRGATKGQLVGTLNRLYKEKQDADRKADEAGKRALHAQEMLTRAKADQERAQGKTFGARVRNLLGRAGRIFQLPRFGR